MLNKAELIKKYGNEKVLCIRNTNIKENSTLNYLDLVKYYGFADYRYNAELNFQAKQIIPYIVIISNNKVFTTKRIKGDARLIGGLSIGTGGHVDSSDVTFLKDYNIDTNTTIGNSMLRELTEETTINTDNIKSLEFIDMFNDDSDEVSMVHLCLLYILKTDDADFDIKETEKLDGSWLTLEELEASHDKLENWSKIALKKVVDNGFLTKTKELKILSVDLANETPKKKTKKVGTDEV